MYTHTQTHTNTHTHTEVIFSEVVALLCSLIRFPFFYAVISPNTLPDHGSPGDLHNNTALTETMQHNNASV